MVNKTEIFFKGWYSNYCNIQAGVVCAIRRGEEPVESIPVPDTPTPDVQCQNADMSGENLQWYSFDHRLDDTVTTKKCFALVNDRQMSLQSAEDFCKTLGPQGYPGSLISIHHHDDMYKLLQVARQIRDAEYWIGLRRGFEKSKFSRKSRKLRGNFEESMFRRIEIFEESMFSTNRYFRDPMFNRLLSKPL